MKQFLHVSNRNLVVALHTRGFAIIVPKNSNNEKKCYRTCELLPPTIVNKNSSGTEEISIQAVSSFVKDDEILYCAVTRSDKQVSIYSIDVTNDDNFPSKVIPSVVYKTFKRACAVTFAQLPSEKNDTLIVMTGDLTGDVTAFPVPSHKDSSSSNVSYPQVSRLLLGHTASMLTSVHVVTQPDDNGCSMQILTSDRDEKVRISHFPRTYQVEGYLLGHTAFISSMDVHSTTKICVTSSGDGTVRLWNYQTCMELASIQFQQQQQQQQPSEDDQLNDDSQKSYKQSDENIIIPINVAISSDGSMISVVQEAVDTVDIYTIETNDEGKLAANTSYNFNKLCSIKCDSQPLATKFMDDGSLLILKRNFNFLLHCTYDQSEKKYTIMNDSEITSALFKLEQEILSKEGEETKDNNDSLSHISMPMTVLEKDDFGNYKLTKISQREKNSVQKTMAWNDPNRIIIAKKASSRRKRKKKESQ